MWSDMSGLVQVGVYLWSVTSGLVQAGCLCVECHLRDGTGKESMCGVIPQGTLGLPHNGNFM